ncbi:methionyl-tRNA formyltransferase [Prochlorococcus marinus]|uniref:Formyl transferase C-terminal domain-containing protein n=1 Tax=Prochlorococcus marinus XMU1408 TaxID=2213228 RepID=A0A318RGS7_PROMR|nr:hypothetical protein [Prochlorococcus marinus]MBW3041845.1 hypothetical protein [Prochlorococcus marinus str. XMU1408]PYE02983.1 hypothetical protein DNJ73_04340 [Prochlorococcus marinus XMU1408]
MEFTLFGCKNTTLHISRIFEKEGCKINLVTINPKKGYEQSVAGYTDLQEHKNLYQSIYIANKYSLKDELDYKFFKESNFKIAFAIGWQRLIPERILKCFSCGVYGMHGSSMDLPFGKGRSPLNWSIIEDRKFFYTNLFKYQAGIDNGPVVGKECFSINNFDTSETLHYKNLLAFINIVKKNWDNIEQQNIKVKKQKDTKGSFYPKRTADDGIIDWNDSIYNIERLIRAVTKPFYGAFSYIKEIKVKIYIANIFYTDLESHSFINAKNGEICDVFPNDKFLVKCQGGVLIVHDYETISDMRNIIKKGKNMDSPEKDIKRFKLNKYGNYDI